MICDVDSHRYVDDCNTESEAKKLVEKLNKVTITFNHKKAKKYFDNLIMEIIEKSRNEKRGRK